MKASPGAASIPIGPAKFADASNIGCAGALWISRRRRSPRPHSSSTRLRARWSPTSYSLTLSDVANLERMAEKSAKTFSTASKPARSATLARSRLGWESCTSAPVVAKSSGPRLCRPSTRCFCRRGSTDRVRGHRRSHRPQHRSVAGTDEMEVDRAPSGMRLITSNPTFITARHRAVLFAGKTFVSPDPPNLKREEARQNRGPRRQVQAAVLANNRLRSSPGGAGSKLEKARSSA